MREPRNLSEWLDERQERQNVLLATLIELSDRTQHSIQQMDLRAREAIRRADLRDHHRSQRPVEEVDLATIRTKIDTRRLEDLTRREKRLVPANALHLGPARLRVFLDAFPLFWPRVIRRLFEAWSPSSEPELSEWADLLASAQAPDGGLTAEVGQSLPTLLRAKGPYLVAEAWKAQSLPSLLEKLEGQRVRLTSTYAGHVVAGWMSGVKGAAQRAAAVDDLCRLERDDPWLPREAVRGGAVATDAARIVVVARLLEWWDSLDQVHHEPIEERLLASDPLFGDPRRESLGRAWEEVRELAPAAFEAFLSTLIQQDLEFFFASVDVDPARKAFWLKYLRSIRRTICVLEPNTHYRLGKKIHAYSADQRASFRRARSFATSDQTETSAFILYFDRFVIVEFSKTGNAAYIYSRDAFASRVSHQGYENVSNLKDRSLCEDRILHHLGWELKAHIKMTDLGVRPAARRQLARAEAASPSVRSPAVVDPVDGHPARPVDAKHAVPRKTTNNDKRYKHARLSLLDAGIQSLRSSNVKVIDNRAKGGMVWVDAGVELREEMTRLQESGLSVSFKAEGGNATKGRPAWIIR